MEKKQTIPTDVLITAVGLLAIFAGIISLILTLFFEREITTSIIISNFITGIICFYFAGRFRRKEKERTEKNRSTENGPAEKAD